MSIGESPASAVARVRSLWRGLRHGNAVEAEMSEEFRHHLALRTRDLIASGLTPDQATRQAKLEFGHIDGHLIDGRKSRGLSGFDQLRFSALDVKLGVRMLVKYPGLSLVAVIGMAVAIAIGAGVFSLITALMTTTVPLPQGDRVVALRNALVTRPTQTRSTLRDFNAWRAELRSVEDLAAFTTVQRNLVVPGAGVELVRVVRMTASGFTLARAAPVLGRPLLEDDERNDARALVIAYEEWQQRFAADPAIIGRHVSLGSDVYTIVGVMPEGFRFPVNDRYWTPLFFEPAKRAQDDAITLMIAGRLTEGATFESTQAELNSIGVRMAAAYPDTHQQLRPQVLAYPRALVDIDNPQTIVALHTFRFLVSLLLVVVAVNVAILVYARTATRVGEIAVRTALGASRARVVTQLFAEALVLSLSAALLGLTLAAVALAKLQTLAEQELTARRFGELPFWIELGLSPAVITYALALAIVGALIVGVVPALKATGRRVHTNLQQLSGRSGTRMQLGRAWTALIIAQVAVVVAVLPFAVHLAQEALRSTRPPQYAVEEFLQTSLVLQNTGVPRRTTTAPALEQLFHARASELIRRLEGDPAVAGITFRSRSNDGGAELQTMASPRADDGPIAARNADIERVEPDFFALHGMPILSGRDFNEADAHAGSVVIVNHVFAERLFGSTSVTGRRLRIVRESASGVVPTGPWLDVVGVVRDFADFETKKVYQPTDLAQLSAPINLYVRTRVPPAISFAPRLREIAASVDPALQLDGLISASEQLRQMRRFPRYIAVGTTAVMLSVLLLSAAGIYAMMSFTVARRRREIGLRSALGANPRRVLSSIFARASAQISAGIAFGLIGALVLERLSSKGPVRDGNLLAPLLVLVLMTTVGLLAAIGPARRGLAVQPTEALREE